MALSIFDEKYPFNVGYTIDDGAGTGGENILQPQYQICRVDHIWTTNIDTIDHVIVLSIKINGSDYQIGSILVPAGAGTGGAKAVDLVAQVSDPPIDGIILSAVDGIAVRLEVAIVPLFAIAFVTQGATL